MTPRGIHVQFVGQLGNQMFLYCMGRILARKTGMAYAPPFCFFDKHGNPLKWSGEPFFSTQGVAGIISTNPVLNIDAVHWADLSMVKPNGNPITIRSGYYQRYEYYREYKDIIRHGWLKIPDHRFKETDPEAIYIHVRRTDFVDIGNGIAPNQQFQCAATTMDEYAACIGRFPGAKRLVLITDNPNDPFLLNFQIFGLPCKFSRSHWDEDFLTLASCRWMIMSQSTFSWWAGFLGKAEKIVCPVFPGSYWGSGDGAIGNDRPRFPNLYVDDEPERWEWVRNG